MGFSKIFKFVSVVKNLYFIISKISLSRKDDLGISKVMKISLPNLNDM